MSSGIGLGFRREIAREIIDLDTGAPDFIEFAPENWIEMGGYWGKILKEATERYPVNCHGLSLSIGSPDPLNWGFLKKLKAFLDTHNVALYSEHLSYSKCDNAHLYDLLPIPFRADAVKHIAQRLREVQDFLERPIALENVSYYTPVGAEMSEAEFIGEVVAESGCQLLLDINNVYVNAFNHNYNAQQFIAALPLNRVAYIHMAGHEQVAPDLIIDTHGSQIIDPVYDLFRWTAPKLNPMPVLLERDFNIPEIVELQREMDQLRQITHNAWNPEYAQR